MWIFCGGMVRSGSTLQFQITAQLIEDAGLGKRIEWVKPAQFPELKGKYAAYSGHKVFKIHECTDAVVSEFRQQNAMGVYVFRDLRDVFVSMMRKEAASFNRLWEAPFLNGCLEQFKKWTSLPGVLVSKYEEIMADLPAEVERIASHLDIQLEAEKYQKIASNYGIERQLKRIETAKEKGELQPGRRGAFFDPRTNLHTNHIQSGAMGEWRQVLSTKQVKLIERKAKDWLLDNGYELA